MKDKIETEIKGLEELLNKYPIDTITKEQAEELKKKQEELMKVSEEVYKKAYEEQMKNQQAGGASASAASGDQGASASAQAGDQTAGQGTGNQGDVVDGDFKEV